jgi:soluble lytic murein transglycosylase
LAEPAVQVAATAVPTRDPRLAQADQLIQNGDLVTAEKILREAAASGGPAVAAPATFALARTLLLDQNPSDAQQTLQSYVGQDQSGEDLANAYFVLAALASNSGDAQTAAADYRQYLDRTTDHRLDGYAQLALARIAESRGDASTALADYKLAVVAGVPASDETLAAGKVGQALTQGGQLSAAADWYRSLAERPGLDPGTRSHYRILAANALRRLGKTDQAQALYQAVFNDASSPVDTVAATAALRSFGSAPNDLEAGLALLKAGQYDQAVQALGDYIDNAPPTADLATARFERGRALVLALQYDLGIGQLRKFMDSHPNDPRQGQAALLVGQALNATSGAASAAGFLEAFALGHPADPQSPAALWAAIQVLQSGGSADSAIPLAKELADRFPTSPYAAQATFIRGWAAYESLDFPAARNIFSSVQQSMATSPGGAAALLWLGKMEQRAGDSSGAAIAFGQAWQANPGDYYAFRARELLQGLNPPKVTPPLGDAAPVPPDQERAQLESWLAVWTGASDGDLKKPYVGAPIAQTSILPRVSALAELGLTDQATQECEAALRLYKDDGRSLYALADTAAAVGLTKESSAIAYQLLLLSPAPNAYQSPRYLQRLVYPYPYRATIEAAAKKYGVDPLLLVALIRQESSFNPQAHSPSNAVGLTQFVPSTAQAVAARVGMANFTLSDLYRPPVAIELGAAYLAAEIKQNGGNPYLALAAYNAGDGAVQSWLSDNPRRDIDLLEEEIPVAETRDYVRNVYRFYQEYLTLYSN